MKSHKALLRHDQTLVRMTESSLPTRASLAVSSNGSSPRTSAPTWCGLTVRMRSPGSGRSGGLRQWIESIIDSLKGQLGLEYHGARTLDR